MMFIEKQTHLKMSAAKTPAILFGLNILLALPTEKLPHNGKDPISIHGIASNRSNDPKRQTIAFANSGQNPYIKCWHDVKMKLSQHHDNMDLVYCNNKKKRPGSIYRPRYGIPMLKIRRSWDILIFNMRILIFIRRTTLYWDGPQVTRYQWK